MTTIRIAAVLVSLSAGCGDTKSGENKGEAPTPKPVKLVATDLSPAGIEATIRAPEGATVKQAFGSAEVATADGSFHLEVSTDMIDMAARKAEIENNDVNKLKRFVRDAPDGLLYESVVMRVSEFHVLVNVDVGETGFECQDSKGPSYTEAQAQAMFTACNTLVAK